MFNIKIYTPPNDHYYVYRSGGPLQEAAGRGENSGQHPHVTGREDPQEGHEGHVEGGKREEHVKIMIYLQDQ